MGGLVSSFLGLLTSLSNLGSSIAGWLNQRTIFNAGRSEGKQEATQNQVNAEQQVVEMQKQIQDAPRVSTPTTVDNDAVDKKLRDGTF